MPFAITSESDITEFEKATFGTGCFWCTEAIFRRIKGVKKVESGYSGGMTENPTYKDVCSDETGHAEVVQVTFDPKNISFGEILEFFWRIHDPTQLNRQGADVGTQYRSVIFYHNEKQREAAEKSLKEHQKNFNNKIMTLIHPFEKFYKAEGYHQEYYEKNKNAPYCRLIIWPKLLKLKMKD